MAMAGFVVVPRALENVARLIRRDLGLVLDRYGCELFPRFTTAELNARLARMEAAARRTAGALEAAGLRGWRVAFPGLASHPDHDLAARFARTGSCVTLHPTVGLEARDRLEPIVNAAVLAADRAGVALVKGVSFGFTASRISAAAAMAELAPPFLRVAVGPLLDTDADTLASVVAHAVVSVDHGA
jgi:threonine dehydratase